MTLGTGPLPAIPPDDRQPGWAVLRDQSAALLERAAALLDGDAQVALEVQAGVCSPDLARRISLNTASFREWRAQAEALSGELARLTYEDRLGAAASRQEAAAAFEAGRVAGRAESAGRHRAPRQRDRAPWLRLAGGGTLAAALAALRIAWKHKLATSAVLAAVTVPVTAAQMHVLPDASAAAPGLPAVSASAPGWGVLVPDPSSSLIALTRAKPNADVAQAGLADPDPPASPALSSTTQASSAPSPGPSSSQPTVTAAGQLQVSSLRLDFGLATTETIQLTARLGPVTWSAFTDSADVSLDSTGGTIPANGSVTVMVSVNPLDTLTQAKITFAVGDYAVSVRVTWTLPPLPPPSLLPTVLPS